MKIGSVFLVVVFLALFGVGIALTYNMTFVEDDIFNQEITNHLIDISESKAEQIIDYFGEREKDVRFLVESEKVKELFKEPLNSKDFLVKCLIEHRGRIITKEIENYLRAFPKMTLKDLQNSYDFQQIAVRSIGEEGYSVIYRVSDLVIYFHGDPNMIGTNMEDLRGEFPEFLNIIDRTKEEPEVEGFYNWKDAYGNVRRKYGSFGVVPVTTADGVELVSVTSDYIDQYKVFDNVSSEIDKYLKDFAEVSAYHNLILISPDGYIAYMIKQLEGLGVNLERGEYAGSGLTKNYFDMYFNAKNIKKGEVVFFGPYVRYYGEPYLKISVMAPVYDGDEFLGIVGLVSDMNKVSEITRKSVGLGETGEAYLINEDKLLITKLKHRVFDLLVQSIKTESSEICIGYFADSEKSDISAEEIHKRNIRKGLEYPMIPFLDYKGDMILGMYYPISGVRWCLMSEISLEEVFILSRRGRIRQYIIVVWSILGILILFSVFIQKYLDKNFFIGKRKIRRYPCRRERGFKFWYCVLVYARYRDYFGNYCRRVVRAINYCLKLKIKNYFLFALIFAIVYFFIVTSFFQGWQNAKLFDIIPDLFIFIVGFLFIHYSLKRFPGKSICNFVFFGGVLICLGKLLEVPFQEYQEMVGYALSWVVWFPILVVDYLGLLFLLFGFRGLKNEF
ncbi:cache domain-containing protein [Candidatus Pacearchaeota archaeon]|nr:cache domain-containing protein [Candidatus Pacearchaeota archaeon]